jgi:outer membrane immunogenic protein
MNKLFITAALAVATITTPAMANDFTGPRAEVNAGIDDVTNARDFNDVTYGAAVGFDVGVTEKVTFGVEATVDNVFDRRDIGAAARLGYVIEDGVLLYGKAGYANYKDVGSRSLDGFRVGGGVDLAIAGPFYTGVEYRYSDFEGGVGKHAGLVKIGMRF